MITVTVVRVKGSSYNKKLLFFIVFLYIIIVMADMIYNSLDFIHNHIMFLNNSKFFAGIVMILLNIGSKFIAIQFSRSTEEYLKLNITKQILVFAMAWMGTRDIYTALILTAVFTVLSDHLFNEESPYCVVPIKFRVFADAVDTNKDGAVSEQEINNAISILEKARRETEKTKQKHSFTLYHNYLSENYKNLL
jgi:hypothetical protein